MEKKSKKEAKEVKMPSEPKKEEKLTYEQLEQVAQSLNQRCQQMYEKLQEANQLISNFNDIGLLLSILNQSSYFNDTFIERCAGKIEEIVTKMLDSVEQKAE